MPFVVRQLRSWRKRLGKGISARPDSKRRDFFEVNLTDGWVYIHVHDAARTVYVVANFVEA